MHVHATAWGHDDSSRSSTLAATMVHPRAICVHVRLRPGRICGAITWSCMLHAVPHHLLACAYAHARACDQCCMAWHAHAGATAGARPEAAGCGGSWHAAADVPRQRAGLPDSWPRTGRRLWPWCNSRQRRWPPAGLRGGPAPRRHKCAASPDHAGPPKPVGQRHARRRRRRRRQWRRAARQPSFQRRGR